MKKFVIIDLFCGAGGTSFGFTSATLNGEQIADVIACVNHDPVAIKSHLANFPGCVHFTEDVRTLDVSKLPRKEPGDDSIWILWASLECTHFSNAKTGSRDADSRTLAHALYPYIHHINPDLIKIENVREFMSWGPLTAKVIKRRADVGDHCPITYDKTTGKFGPHFVPESRTKGRDYLKWRQTIESFGYRYKSKLLNSADFGAYQARLRYFGVFAKPGLPITFPTPTNDKHGRHGLPRWRAVRDVLELHEVGQSIFTRKKPLSPKTLERVLAGLLKFVKPEIDKAGVTASYLVSNYSGKPESRALSIDAPCPTLTTVPHESIVHVEHGTRPGFLIQYNGTPDGSGCTKAHQKACPKNQNSYFKIKKSDSKMSSLPISLPKCPIHGLHMLYQAPGTPEQAWCGAWYKCPACGHTILLISTSLESQIMEQNPRLWNTTAKHPTPPTT